MPKPKESLRRPVDLTKHKRISTKELLARLKAEGKTADDWYREQGWTPPQEGNNAGSNAEETGPRDGQAGAHAVGTGQAASGRPGGNKEGAGRDERAIIVSAGEPEQAPPPSHQSYQTGSEVSQQVTAYTCGDCGYDILYLEPQCPSCRVKLRWERI